jgi:hypothetical protein
MKTTRPVFESFYSFVDFLNESIEGNYDDYLLEDEGDPGDELDSGETGKLSEFSNSLKGMEKINPKFVEKLSASFKTLVTDAGAKALTDYAQEIASFAASTKSGIKVARNSVQGGGSKGSGVYKWLINGTCKVSGQPVINDEGVVTQTTTTVDDKGKNFYSLSDVLSGMLQRNLKALSDVLATRDEKIIQKAANGGRKGQNGLIEQKKLLTIDPASIKTRILEIIPFEEEFHAKPKKDTRNGEKIGPEDGYLISFDPRNAKDTVKWGRFEYAFLIPIWTLIPSSIKASSNKVDEKTYTTVLPPSQGTEIKIVDKPFDSSKEQFFSAGSTTLLQSGVYDMKAMLSQFNSIEKIKVVGGASQAPTKYVSSNEETKKEITQENTKAAKVLIGNGYLAYDRMLAGVSAFEKMKEDGIEQLKNCTIEKSTAEEILKNVQTVDAESDPKMQQITFFVSGMVKGIDQIIDNNPTIIKKTVDIKSQEVKLVRFNYILAFNMKKQ